MGDMGKRDKKIDCPICLKGIRSDKLKKHKEVCKKREEKKSAFIQNEADHSSDSEIEAIPVETVEDREFIDENEEPPEEGSFYNSIDNEANRIYNDNEKDEDARIAEEVERRLAQLRAVRDEQRKTQTACKHCGVWCENGPEHENHESKCKYRLVKCFKCGKDVEIQCIKVHIRSACPGKGKKAEGKKKEPKEKEPKKKGPKGKKKTPKKKEGNKKKDNPKKKGKARGKSIGGKQFKMQIHGAKKYTIVKRLTEYNSELNEYMIPDIIKQFVFGNEFGSGPRPKPHCHGVMVLKKRMKFEDFKAWFKTKTKLTIHDVRSCKNLQHEVKYVTKEDYRAVNYKFDNDMMDLIKLAYMAAQKYNKLFSSMYPYCRLPAFQKRIFEQHFAHFLVERKDELSLLTFIDSELHHWQLLIEAIINSPAAKNDDRSIIWIVDKEGNKGKSFLSFYLRMHYNAFRVTGNVKTTDFAFAYNEEPIVIFDLARDSEGAVNYHLMEEIKNGSLWSPKYESSVKNFHHSTVIVLVFSNFEPNYSKLSYDRWRMFHLTADSELLPFKAPVLPQAFALEGLHDELPHLVNAFDEEMTQ